MKLYDYAGAPNPRRVKIFAAEKNISLEIIPCNMAKGEHKTPEFLKKNPSGKIPVLELDDGRTIAESVAICRYLEAVQSEPNLFGRDAYELGFIEARNRQIEFELWSQVGVSWVNGPIVTKIFNREGNAPAKAASDKAVKAYHQRLNNELSDQEFVAGDRFTVADISLLSAIDFGATMVGLKPNSDLSNLSRWHKLVSARDSVKQNAVDNVNF